MNANMTIRKEIAEKIFPVIFIVLVLGLCGLIIYDKVIKPFLKNRKYIMKRIYKSKSKNEKAYWQYKLNKLYVSLIPFFGKKIAKSMKTKYMASEYEREE